MLSLAMPVVVAEVGWMAMQIVDISMVGRLGPEAIGAGEQVPDASATRVEYVPHTAGARVATATKKSWGTLSCPHLDDFCLLAAL